MVAKPRLRILQTFFQRGGLAAAMAERHPVARDQAINRGKPS
jgi:hypothetical protein